MGELFERKHGAIRFVYNMDSFICRGIRPVKESFFSVNDHYTIKMGFDVPPKMLYWGEVSIEYTFYDADGNTIFSDDDVICYSSDKGSAIESSFEERIWGCSPDKLKNTRLIEISLVGWIPSYEYLHKNTDQPDIVDPFDDMEIRFSPTISINDESFSARKIALLSFSWSLSRCDNGKINFIVEMLTEALKNSPRNASVELEISLYDDKKHMIDHKSINVLSHGEFKHIAKLNFPLHLFDHIKEVGVYLTGDPKLSTSLQKGDLGQVSIAQKELLQLSVNIRALDEKISRIEKLLLAIPMLNEGLTPEMQSITVHEEASNQASPLTADEIRITDLDLTARSFNCLAHVGIWTVADLLSLCQCKDDMMNIKGLGKKSADEIIGKIVSLGFNPFPNVSTSTSTNSNPDDDDETDMSLGVDLEDMDNLCLDDDSLDDTGFIEDFGDIDALDEDI